MTFNTEEWRTIPKFPSYSVSTHGRVKRTVNSKTSKAGKILKTAKSGYYPAVVLREGGKSTTQYLHYLVASTFLGDRPTPKHEVAHGDGNKDNPRLDNLRWATRLENCADKKLHGTDQVGDKHHMRKIREVDVHAIRSMKACGVYNKDIAEIYGLHPSYISLVVHGKRWGHVA